MQHLHGLTFNLVIADAIGHNEHLTASVRVLGIDDTRLKHDIVKTWSTRYVLSIQSIRQTNRTVESRQRHRRVWGSEHQTVNSPLY